MKARGYCLLDDAWGEIKLAVWERRERVRCAMGSSGVGCTVVGLGAVCVLALLRLSIEYEGADAVCNGVGDTLGAAFCGGSTLGAACWGEGVAGFCVGWESGCTIRDCMGSCVRSTGAGGFIGGTSVGMVGCCGL